MLGDVLGRFSGASPVLVGMVVCISSVLRGFGVSSCGGGILASVLGGMVLCWSLGVGGVSPWVVCVVRVGVCALFGCSGVSSSSYIRILCVVSNVYSSSSVSSSDVSACLSP